MAAVDVQNIDVFYGDIQVLWDVSMRIDESDDIVALIGPNGAGKTTMLKSISGLLDVGAGSISVFDEDVATLTPSELVQRGFVHVPEERNLFPRMTVLENLEMGAYSKQAREERAETLETVFEYFPILEEKKRANAQNLSGGQQQMLAIGRGLMSQPKILALDEPSTGLAPQIAENVFSIVEDLSAEITVFLIEQHVSYALDLANRAYVLENGRITIEGTGQELLDSDHVKEAYLQA